MRFVSANLFLLPGTNAHSRAAEFARRIHLLEPDVVGVQEVHTPGLRDHLTQLLAPSLGYMRYYPGHFGPAGGLVTYANQPIQPLRYVSMAEVSRQLGRRKLLKNRALGCAHKGMLITRVGGVTTANVHLSPNHFETWAQGNGAEEVQTAQMAIVTREVCALSAAKRLAVFGDFNIVKSCQLHRRLIDTGLIDPFGDEGTCSARTGEHSFDWMMFGGQVGLPRVTYPTVLYARERLPAAFIWAAPISDHSPLVADADW